MSRPPEYGQVAEWLHAIDPDAGYLRGFERGYYDIKYAEDNGLTLAMYVISQWRFQDGQARQALDGLALEGASLDEVAGAYHRKQIAEYAGRCRALQQQIRALENGDFEPPRSCADRNADNRARAALDQADLALRARSRTGQWAWNAAYQASRRTEPARLAATSFPRTTQASAEFPTPSAGASPGGRAAPPVSPLPGGDPAVR